MREAKSDKGGDEPENGEVESPAKADDDLIGNGEDDGELEGIARVGIVRERTVQCIRRAAMRAVLPARLVLPGALRAHEEMVVP